MPESPVKANKQNKEGPEPKEFAKPYGNFQPFMSTDQLEKYMKWINKQDKTSNISKTTAKHAKKGEHHYVRFDITNDNDDATRTEVVYLGQVIHITKTTVRYHFQDASIFSEVEEDKYCDVETKQTVYKITPPTDPKQQRTDLTEEMISKVKTTLDEYKKDTNNQINSLKALFTAQNINADKALGVITKLRLPPPPEKVEVAARDDPNKAAKECTIAGVPYKQDEDVVKIVEEIIKKKGLTIRSEDFTAFRAVRKGNNPNNNDKPPIIIVAFRTNTMKTDFKRRTNDESNNNENPIYINENLTKEQGSLFYAVRQFKKKYSYTYAWTRNGVPQLRKNSESDHISIQIGRAHV